MKKLYSFIFLFTLSLIFFPIGHSKATTKVYSQEFLLNLINNRTNDVIYLENGEYYINNLTIPKNLSLIGKNQTKFILTNKSKGLKVNSNTQIKNIKFICGNDRAIIVEEFAKDIILENNSFTGIRNITNSFATAILINNNTKNITISNNNFSKFYATNENKVIGDNIGAVRAIYSKKVENLLIKSNSFEQIGGYEDGDAIHIQTSKGANNIYAPAKVTIIENSFKQSKKRAIKLQASNVNIFKNTFYTKDSKSISEIYAENSSDILIHDNSFKNFDTKMVIQFHKTLKSKIEHNSISVSKNKRIDEVYVILIEDSNNILLNNNTLNGCKSLLTNSSDITLTENSFITDRGKSLTINNSSNVDIYNNDFKFTSLKYKPIPISCEEGFSTINVYDNIAYSSIQTTFINNTKNVKVNSYNNRIILKSI